MEKILVAGRKGVVKKKPKVRSVRCAECDRNHAVKDGGYVVDGCKEFIASDENGGSPLTCSCCGCHRNFHRIVEETDQESFGVEEQKEKKKRKLKSKVWDDFTKCTDKDGNEWAVCKRCEEKFDGSSKKGTTHLKNHLVSKICQNKRKGDGDDENEDTSTQGDGDDENEESCVIDLIDLNFDEGFWGPSVTNSFALPLPLSPQSPVMLRKYSPFDIF